MSSIREVNTDSVRCVRFSLCPDQRDIFNSCGNEITFNHENSGMTGSGVRAIEYDSASNDAESSARDESRQCQEGCYYAQIDSFLGCTATIS